MYRKHTAQSLPPASLSALSRGVNRRRPGSPTTLQEFQSKAVSRFFFKPLLRETDSKCRITTPHCLNAQFNVSIGVFTRGKVRLFGRKIMTLAAISWILQQVYDQTWLQSRCATGPLRFQVWNLSCPTPTWNVSDTLSIMKPVAVILSVTKAGSDSCEAAHKYHRRRR